MSSLLFTRGLNPPQTLSDPVTSGETTFALTNADLFFSPGELLFIGDADGTYAEFLGSVSSVDSGSIASTLPALTARAAGASLFSPIDSVRTTGRLDPPLQRHLDTGIRSLRTLGGQVVAIRTAQPAGRIELRITGLTPDEDERLINELNAATDHGRLPFTLVSSSRRILALQIQDPGIQRTSTAGGHRTLRFNAFDLGESTLL